MVAKHLVIYFADTLPKQFSAFAEMIKRILQEEEFAVQWLPGTHDIWARDYMPVRAANGQWVQFTYAPDYLMASKSGCASITDVTPILDSLGIEPKRTSIIADGGNIVRFGRKALACHKLLLDNPGWQHPDLIAEVKSLLGLDQMVLLPREPGDIFGHADGMARFVDEETVLVNDYSWRKDRLRMDVLASLYNAGLKVVELPYDPGKNRSWMSVRGSYINFVQLDGDRVLVPVFGDSLDETALSVLRKHFGKVIPVPCAELSKKGGLLHCVSWGTP
jgi:agmatine deiminase